MISPPGDSIASDGLVTHCINNDEALDCYISAIGAAGLSGGGTKAAESGFEYSDDPFAFLARVLNL